MFNGLISVAVVFIIFSVGFVFTVKKVWPDNAAGVLSAIVVKVAAPCLAVISFYDRLTPELLKGLLLLIAAGAAHAGCMYVSGKGLSRLLGLSGGRRVMFEVSFTFSNTIFIGLPVNQIVFGPEGLTSLFAYYIITLAGFWSVGAYEISRASPLDGGSGGGFSPRKILSPGLVGVFVGMGVVGLQVHLPVVLDSSIRYLSALCVPLSLLVIGSNLSSFARGFSRPKRDELLVMAGKFLISPAFMFAILRAFGVTGLPFRVLMLTSVMPCHMQASINAQYYGVEGEYAARLVSLSTLLCLVTIPVSVALLR
ncbi:MAG: AEC family transporter [Clostridiales Family XIII bacterium]|jgi:predicted permease|nr:AEC family transporter [Clostridiales Family XIII bacterium]